MRYKPKVDREIMATWPIVLFISSAFKAYCKLEKRQKGARGMMVSFKTALIFMSQREWKRFCATHPLAQQLNGAESSLVAKLRAAVDAALAEPGTPRLAWKEDNMKGLRRLLETRFGSLGSVSTLRGGYGTSLFNYLDRLGEQFQVRFVIW